MKVITPPHEPWLHERYQCHSCGAIVQFETHDRGDSAFVMGSTGPTRSRCVHCRTPFALFARVEEDDVSINDEALADATYAIGQSLAMCLLCKRGYPPAEMWPRPDGYVCDECQGKRSADD